MSVVVITTPSTKRLLQPWARRTHERSEIHANVSRPGLSALSASPVLNLRFLEIPQSIQQVLLLIPDGVLQTDSLRGVRARRRGDVAAAHCLCIRRRLTWLRQKVVLSWCARAKEKMEDCFNVDVCVSVCRCYSCPSWFLKFDEYICIERRCLSCFRTNRNMGVPDYLCACLCACPTDWNGAAQREKVCLFVIFGFGCLRI